MPAPTTPLTMPAASVAVGWVDCGHFGAPGLATFGAAGLPGAGKGIMFAIRSEEGQAMPDSGQRTPRLPPKQLDTEAFHRAAKAYVAKATVSKEAAAKALQDIGTHDAKGRLTKFYR